jgi:hypothetical protein
MSFLPFVWLVWVSSSAVNWSLAMWQILFPLATEMADGKYGFNELLFSFGD